MNRCVLWALAIVLVLLGLAAATREDRTSDSVQVTTKKLAPYSVVKADDLKTATRHVEGGDVVKNPTDAAGKVLAAAVAKDAPIPASKLVDRTLVDGRSPLTLVATASPDAPGVGKAADLVVSPRNEKGGGTVVKGVTVLAVTKGKDSTTYTVAVTESQRQDLAPLLGFSDVRVTPPGPLPHSPA